MSYFKYYQCLKLMDIKALICTNLLLRIIQIKVGFIIVLFKVLLLETQVVTLYKYYEFLHTLVQNKFIFFYIGMRNVKFKIFFSGKESQSKRDLDSFLLNNLPLYTDHYVFNTFTLFFFCKLIKTIIFFKYTPKRKKSIGYFLSLLPTYLV